jgi:sterol 14-demethylase
MKLRIVVDTQLCQGHAVCMGEAPDIFEVTRDGKLTVLDAAPPAALRTQLEAAVRYCPTGALSLVQEGE